MRPVVNRSFTYADLTGVTLFGANLTDATFVGTELIGVTWGHTLCPDGTSSRAYSPETCIGHGI